MRIILKFAGILALILSGLYSCKNSEGETVNTSDITSAGSYKLVVDFADRGIEIQPTMYGIFYEDINFAADGGIYAELVKNRSFEFDDPKLGWIEPNSAKYFMNKESGFASVIKHGGTTTNHNYVRVKVNNDSGYVLINEGFRGIGIEKGAKYNLSFQAARHSGDIRKVKFQLTDTLDQVLAETLVEPKGNEWQVYESQLIPEKTELKARLKITFEGTGEIDLDMVSLFPEDTWKGRKKGLRKDLIQLLADLNPGFLRFPGGCIVEGRTLEQRYQWKKTVGPAFDREFLINRWNTEFSHRPAPDYYQSFGLGFYEYFQLSEDLGAEPIPILGCGMACQFNTGELVPLDELDPYIQDALDLIEFANGGTNTTWGKLRADMGHPEPFNMKYIGIGNEQWGPDYFERYKLFAERIYKAYPDIKIVSTPGPFPEGDFFEYGWEQMKKLKADIADEHFYQNPSWFLENAERYDSYDRNGPKVFAGEYAAQSVQTTSPENQNNWETALAEAAFMTGLERNADVVVMTSYAPLMAHEEGWQWKPDLIWFNNLDSYGTPNYYVQKLYATHAGTDLLAITENGKALTGQHHLYASAVKDANSNALIIKAVNTGSAPQTLIIEPLGAAFANGGTITRLQSDDLSAMNSFESPRHISPESEEFQAQPGKIELVLAPNSMNVIQLGIE